MTKPWIAVLLSMLTIGSLTIAGCRSQQREEVVEENTPPNVIALSPEAVRSIGISMVSVGSRSVAGQLVTTAEIKASENRVFHISPFTSGRIIQDHVTLGDRIRQGQTLAVVQNLDIAKIQADFIHELHSNEVEVDKARTRLALAQKNLERERRLLAEGISPRKDYQQAEAEAAIAKSEYEGELEHRVHIKAEGQALLGAYGMKPESMHTERIRTGSPVTAPRSGVVTRKNTTLGDMVTPETVMYEVSDLSQIWLDVAVYPKDLSSVRIGQTVTFTTDSLPNRSFIGQVNYIAPTVSEARQTYLARAYLSNPDGILKPGMFGQARLDLPVRQSKSYIPESAIQKYGREVFVFIPLENNRFRKQTVVLGSRVGDGYFIESGLTFGQQVVGQGSFTLKSELLKGQFAEEEE